MVLMESCPESLTLCSQWAMDFRLDLAWKSWRNDCEIDDANDGHKRL